jgi:hypothetical protein
MEEAPALSLPKDDDTSKATSTQDNPNSSDSEAKPPQQLSIKQLKEYPESVRKLTLPEPTKEGQVQVGASRGRPFWLSYKIYGSGPKRIVWLCGHGDTIRAWRRHVLHFGHGNDDM